MIPLIIFFGKTLLFRQKSLAMNLACCCGEAICCCLEPLNFETSPPPQTLTLTVDAPGCPKIDGKVFTLSNVAAQADECVAYSGGGNIGSCDIPVGVSWYLACLDGSKNCQGFKLNFSPGASGCDATGVNRVASTQCTCKPFFLRFEGFILRDNQFVTNECNCCPGGFAVQVTP